MLAKEIIDKIESYFPLEKQENWDKSGLQIGDINTDITKIMIALNCDIETINECIKEGCQMLFTHHPFLLDTINNYDTNAFGGQLLQKALSNNIVVYSAHTSLDSTYMNHWLMECLDVNEHANFEAEPMATIGTLSKTYSKDAFIQHVKEAFNLDHFKYAGDIEKIKTVAVLGGSGAELLEMLEGKVDAFITGDSKYRHAKWAVDHHMLLVDVNHHVENIMIFKCKEIFEKETDLEVVLASSKDYYHYV